MLETNENRILKVEKISAIGISLLIKLASFDNCNIWTNVVYNLVEINYQ